ncbi:MAG: fluoride efflux transporter CrcB [Minwuia sp.]|nr:fluoride efflux transporter CrcB [Minwuia sp.]
MMSPGLIVAIALGGAVGAVLRYSVVQTTLRLWGTGFPVGTLAVNVIGSLAMGLAVEWLAARGMSDAWRGFVMVGLLGALTTFSTFSLDVALLHGRGEMALAALYVMLSVCLSVGALFLGLWLGRGMFA